MQNSTKTVAAVALLTALTGCTSGQSGVEPAFQSVNLNSNKLQFAIGVATFANGSTGLNVVPMFRQPNGLSATLLNTPLLSGPFVVPAGSFLNPTNPNLATVTAGIDAGSGMISGSPQVQPGVPPAVTTFGQAGGIFSSGFAPENSTTSGAASFGLYLTPLYTVKGGPVSATTYRGGPPAYPQVRNGQYPAAFVGFPQGFTSFVVTPVVGAYSLSVGIQDGNGATTTIAAPPATLGSAAGLAASSAPTVTKDGSGGLSVAFTAPVGTTESLVDIVDRSVIPNVFYTVLTSGAGPQIAVLPANLGPFSSGQPTVSIATGDTYSIRLVNLDYPGFESGVPQNTQQTPTLAGLNGQADISYAPVVGGTY